MRLLPAAGAARFCRRSPLPRPRSRIAAMLRRRWFQFMAACLAALVCRGGVGELGVGDRLLQFARARSASALATATGQGIILAWCSGRRRASGFCAHERGAARVPAAAALWLLRQRAVQFDDAAAPGCKEPVQSARPCPTVPEPTPAPSRDAAASSTLGRDSGRLARLVGNVASTRGRSTSSENQAPPLNSQIAVCRC